MSWEKNLLIAFSVVASIVALMWIGIINHALHATQPRVRALEMTTDTLITQTDELREQFKACQAEAKILGESIYRNELHSLFVERRTELLDEWQKILYTEHKRQRATGFGKWE